MFGTARNSVKSNPVSGKTERAESGQRLGRSIERHVNNVSCVPAIPPVRIAIRHCEKTMRRKNCGGPMTPSQAFFIRAVQKQNRGKRAIAGWTVTPTPVRQGAPNDLQRHEKSSSNIAHGRAWLR